MGHKGFIGGEGGTRSGLGMPVGTAGGAGGGKTVMSAVFGFTSTSGFR